MINNNSRSPFRFVFAILILSAIFYGLYLIGSFIFSALNFLALALFIGALILNKNVVINYFKNIFKQLKENLPLGIILVLVTVFGYGVVSGYLFFKAIINNSLEKKMRESGHHQDSEYIEYEEVSSDNYFDLDNLQKKVKQLNKPKPSENENNYL